MQRFDLFYGEKSDDHSKNTTAPEKDGFPHICFIVMHYHHWSSFDTQFDVSPVRGPCVGQERICARPIDAEAYVFLPHQQANEPCKQIPIAETWWIWPFRELHLRQTCQSLAERESFASQWWYV